MLMVSLTGMGDKMRLIRELAIKVLEWLLEVSWIMV